MRENLPRPPDEFSDRLLAEIARWRPEPAARQDDITFVVVDIEGPAALAPGGQATRGPSPAGPRRRRNSITPS